MSPHDPERVLGALRALAQLHAQYVEIPSAINHTLLVDAMLRYQRAFYGDNA